MKQCQGNELLDYDGFEQLFDAAMQRNKSPDISRQVQQT